MDQTTVKAAQLAYDLTYPPGDKERNLPPVILLHGMLDSRKTWKGLCDRIAQGTGRKVYAVDARNHGDSEWSTDFNFDILAMDLDNFMNEMGIPKAILIGHSMGGKTALTLALKQPQKVEKLIVEDMTPRNFTPGVGKSVLQIIAFMRASLSEIPPEVDEETAKRTIMSFAESVMPAGQTTGKQMNLDSSTIPLKRTDKGYSWKANLDVIEEVLTSKERLKQNLSGIYQGDALFLYGKKSFFKIENEDLISKLFPNAQRVGVEGAAHLIHHEFPEDFLKEVIQFIDGGSVPKFVSKY